MGNTVKADIIILGCGGSGGTPLTGGHWGACDPAEPKNKRTRPALAIRTARTCVVIDTGPDFREQTLSNNISDIDAVIYTHDHADHVNGFDDVRYAAIKRRIHGENDFIMPIYATEETLSSVQDRFPYMFRTSPDGLYYPLIQDNILSASGSLTIDDIQMTYFPQIHGMGTSIGFKIGTVGYSTDVSDFEMESLQKLRGIRTWIVDCGQYGAADEQITVHPNLDRVLKWNETVQAEKLYLTHLTPRHDYQTINNETPDYIECAYDGMIIQAEL